LPNQSLPFRISQDNHKRRDVLETEAGSTCFPRCPIRKYSYPQPAVAVVLAECVNAKYYLVVVKYTAETPYFSRKEQQDNWRLGCQVKVKAGYENNPASVMGIKKNVK
jgi:Na+-transporting NADH:ubiquinone oxidoreductase subunit F